MTTTKKPSQIPGIFAQLAARAATTGEDRGHTFRHGARLAVRVRGGRLTLTIARREKPVGDTEIVVFRRDCGVPESAERTPREGQKTTIRDGQTWHYLTYSWDLE